MDSPTAILNDVARIAGVPEAKHSSMCRLLSHAIARAKKDSAKPAGKRISSSALIKDFYGPIARAANKLQTKLERLEGTNLKIGEAPRSMAASHFFSEALLSQTKPKDCEEPIADLIHSLNLALIAEIALQSGKRARSWLAKPGRKIGTGYAAFDHFVMALLLAAEVTGGRLTIYKTSYKEGSWDGSLLRAMQRLRPLLPKSQFFPASKLGNALNTAYQRYRSEAGKPRRKKA